MSLTGWKVTGLSNALLRGVNLESETAPTSSSCRSCWPFLPWHGVDVALIRVESIIIYSFIHYHCLELRAWISFPTPLSYSNDWNEYERSSRFQTSPRNSCAITIQHRFYKHSILFGCPSCIVFFPRYVVLYLFPWFIFLLSLFTSFTLRFSARLLPHSRSP